VKKLIRIQQELKAPKNQFNKFGGYAYRSCEDILEAVKPLLSREGLVLTLSDEVQACGDYVYVVARASISDGQNTVSVTACARDSIDRKGMDGSQVTGAASSYARKYALNGLFLIDDTKDADHGEKPADNASTASEDVLNRIECCRTLEELKQLWEELGKPKGFAKAIADRKKEIEIGL